MARWFPLIGLEIHAQLNTKTKLFSNAAKKFLAAPNSCVSNFDASVPGTLPVLNRKCVELAIATSYALNCKVNMRSSFDRKHYFYADMPHGYQITQHRSPIARNGFVEYLLNEEIKRVDIEQIQLEQDSGKSLHDDKEHVSLIDLNRAGVGLIEIVTRPSMQTSDEACSFVQQLALILDYVGSCSGKMEEGELRVDANISVSDDVEKWGVRSEIKNISGLRGLRQAIDFEIKRQISVLERGGKVVQETRALNSSGETVSLREKETSYDYRFMPDGNLPTLVLYDDQTVQNARYKNAINVDAIRASLPLLPQHFQRVLLDEFKLNQATIDFMLENKMAEYYTTLVRHRPLVDKMLTFDFIRCNLLPHLIKNCLTFKQSPISAASLGELLHLTHTYRIDGTVCNKVFKHSLETGACPLQMIEENDWYKENDMRVLEEWVAQAVRIQHESPFELPASKKKYERQKKKLVTATMRQVSVLSGGRAHAKLTRKLVTDHLDSLWSQQQQNR